MFWAEETDSSNDDFVSETASLETDVFRFLAIISFCLLAIFTLVQAIPMTGSETGTPIEDPAQKLKEQQKQLVDLQAENQRLKKDIDRLLSETALAEPFKRELERAQEELDSQRHEIQKLATEKLEKDKDILLYKSQLEKRDKEIRRIEDEKRRVESALQKSKEAIKQTQPEAAIKETERPKPSGVGEKRGLYVAFENDSVFMDLLKSKKITLHIRVPGLEKGFQAVPRNGQVGFESSGPPSGLDLWEIKEDMVPERIIRDFKAWTTLGSQKKMFVVGLTPEISTQVRGRADASGKIIIGPAGKITYSRD